MIKKLLAATALCLAPLAASAADLPSRKAPAPVVAAVPTFSWTGFYIGANAGYAWSDQKISYENDTIVTFLGSVASKKDGSFTSGAQLGYNYQVGGFVVGAEADFNFADLKYSESWFRDYGYAYDTVDTKSKVEWFGTVRARLGFTPAERLLVYATGGLAYGSVKGNSLYTVTYPGSPAQDGSVYSSVSDTRVGWTIGAGAEYAFTNNLSLKAEYLYVDLGSKSYSLAGRYWNGDPLSYDIKDEAKFHVVRAGLNYRF